MFRIILGVLGVNFTLFGVSELRGIPLTLFVFSVLYTLGVLPETVRTQGGGLSATDVVSLLVLQDFLQYLVHVAEHKANCASHRIHHTRTHPKTADAFHAGLLDIALQLFSPLFVSIWCVRPTQESLTAFGALYALWLQWIHDDCAASLKCRSRFMVTPFYHRTHHAHPTKNFGHFLTVWDVAFGTQHRVNDPS